MKAFSGELVVATGVAEYEKNFPSLMYGFPSVYRDTLRML